jgi:hypothetical protein
MGLLEDILNKRGDELTGALTQGAGFDAGQAAGFLPPALEGMLGAVSGGGLDLGALLGGADASSWLEKIDLAQLASAAGIGEGKAESGIQALIPVVLSVLKDEGGGAAGILSALGGSDAGGALGKLAGKLFG